MALQATIYQLRMTLSDVDRGVYEEIDLRLARHPSESARYLLTRTLAYALLYQDGIAFSHGLAESDEPAVWVKDLQGTTTLWCDIGNPSPERLHRASKATPEVVIYTHLDPGTLRRQALDKTVFRGDQISITSIPVTLLDSLERVLDRTLRWEVVRTDGQLYVTVAGQRAPFEGVLTTATLLDTP